MVAKDRAELSSHGHGNAKILANLFVAAAIFLATAANAADIIFLVNNSGMQSGDSDVKILAEELGHTVTVVTAPVTVSQTVGKDLVLFSSSYNLEFDAGFKSLAIPVVVWNFYAWDQFAMVDEGIAGGYQGENSVHIANSSHPMAAGLSGSITTTTGNFEYCFGKPTASAQVAAKWSGESGTSDYAAIWGYETGAAMGYGYQAPARRVGMFISGDIPTDLTSQGKALVKAAISWSLANSPPNITIGPMNRFVHERQSAFFSIVSASTLATTYQWQKNGANIPGATASSYTTPGSLLADSGAVFRCIATNSSGSNTSGSATLSVVARPAPKTSELISVAGFLTAADGTPIGVGTPVNKDITVKIFTALTSGTLVHQETFLAANSQAVPVKDGRFVARLGLGASQTEIQDILATNPDLYAEFLVGNPGSQETLSPRIPITSPAQAGTPRLNRGYGAPTATAQEGALYQNLNDNGVWMRVAHSWVKISN